MPKRISDVFSISSDELRKEGVFDGFIDIDSKFYVDPRLLKETKIDELQGTYSKFQTYFASIFNEIYQLKENQTNTQQIIYHITDKLKFKENSLAGLGYSTNHTEGKGIGEKLAEKLAQNAVHFAIELNITDPAIFEMTPLFEENFGADRISDMTVDIILTELLTFSERVAKNFKLPTFTDTSIRNQKFNLPYYLTKGVKQPLILVPEDILTKLPVASSKCFNDYDSIVSHNDKLRAEVNRIIDERDQNIPTWEQVFKKLKKAKIKELITKNPKLLINLIDKYKSKQPNSYHFDSDLDNEFRWYTTAKNYAINFPLELKKIVYQVQDFHENVEAIVNKFSDLISQKDLCVELYNDLGKPIREKFSQLILLKLVEEYISQNSYNFISRISIEYKSNNGMIILANEQIMFLESVILLKYSSETKEQIYKSFNKLVDYINQYSSKEGIFLLLATDERHLYIQNELYKMSEIEKRNERKTPNIILVDGRIKFFGRKKVASSKYF
ncbi:hypothetical protein HUN01_18800 [Nostoc edaphicum CCNP1411]|uniref:Uncharacterized protein n=1 Tax=Nostoc edaphicum CCNP1411 TaxID=1472755 RepID=A0A7D7R4R5_9NOSO|nr:hypothetical protein [Nostoc edaphicum]QMS89526.1 hypothetical protein HUN01_18800 [Nostoc edaphicum CCNP1411]